MSAEFFFLRHGQNQVGFPDKPFLASQHLRSSHATKAVEQIMEVNYPSQAGVPIMLTHYSGK